jgi:hypothetical protein
MREGTVFVVHGPAVLNNTVFFAARYQVIGHSLVKLELRCAAIRANNHFGGAALCDAASTGEFVL